MNFNEAMGAARRMTLLGAKASTFALAGAMVFSGVPATALADDAPAAAEQTVADETAQTGTSDENATPETSTADAEAQVQTAADAPATRSGLIGSAAELSEGVNIMKTGATDQTFSIGEGQALMISGQEADDAPIVFSNCTFNLSGGTVRISGDQQGISYNNGEVVTKLWIGGNVQFDNCTFVTAEGAKKTTTAGYDAAVYFFGGNIDLNGCTLKAEGYNGQFLGLYGSTGAVTFDDCDISTVGNKNGWSYAMYGGSVLKLLNGSTLTATGSTTDSGNINCFYSGDNRTGYDAVFIEDSTVDFSDNKAGGFAINNVNIHVTNSEIHVNDNLGNACNSGYWIVDNSTIQMNGNRGGHALSCIGFEMTGSTLEVLHNGYAGVYLQSRDSSLTDCTVDIRCNGERLLSYTAGDLWLNGHALTVNGGTSFAQEGSPWLGGVGRTGEVVTTGTTSVVAYDLSSNAVDNLKSNTTPVLTRAQLALDSEADEHVLFLNPFMESDYARGNAESSASNNDADLFADDRVTDPMDIIGADTAKIGTMTTAQLAHHKYDWANGEVTAAATQDAYGIKRFACTDTCADYVGHTGEHGNSFDCAGTYVYAPLVGISFEANTGSADEDAAVTGVPETQDGVDYGTAVAAPEAVPSRPDDSADWDWQFTGWYTDAACTQQFDFSTALTDNWTTLYAGWKKVDVEKPEQPGGGSDTTDKTDNTEKKPVKGNLPQTGDISVVATAAVAVAGAVAAGAGAAIKRRRK